MSDYIGEKCIICEKKFVKDDEIVVCPECGTPYHRECYFKEGKCVNNILHSNNKSWKSSLKTDDKEHSEKIKCKICGTENPQNGIFCTKCGNPLSQKSQASPFQQGNVPPFITNAMGQATNQENKFTLESEVDGIKIKEYNEYVGSNQKYFIPHLLKFGKLGGKFSLNFSAFLFPEYYFFYRKMNLIGLVFLIVGLFFQFPTIIEYVNNGSFNGTIIGDYFSNMFSEQSIENISNITSFIYMCVRFVSGLFANWLYYKKAKRDINIINSQDVTDDEKLLNIAQKGGVSPRNMFIAFITPLLLLIVILLISTFS